MKFYRCDVCGKEIKRWYKINVVPMTLYPSTNISNMVKNSKDKDICEDCFNNLFLRGKQ